MKETKKKKLSDSKKKAVQQTPCNVEKLKALMKWLGQQDIRFEIDREPINGFRPALWVQSRYVAVWIHRNKGNAVFTAWRTHCHPLFIRPRDTAERVVEKMRNLLADIDAGKATLLDPIVGLDAASVTHRRKRITVPKYEKVEPRGRKEAQP